MRDLRAASDVVGGDRFLEPVDILISHPAHELDRDRRCPGVVGVDGEADVGTDRGARGATRSTSSSSVAVAYSGAHMSGSGLSMTSGLRPTFIFTVRNPRSA